MENLVEKIGSVCFSDDDKITFWLKDNSTVCYGEIHRIPVGDIVYYTRVFHSESGTTVDETSQLVYADGKEDFGPYSTFRKIGAQLILQKHRGILRSPTLNPPYGSAVYRLTEEDRKLMKLEGTFNIGKLRVGTDLFGDVGIDDTAIPTHMIVCGKTGCGKSTAESGMNKSIICNEESVALMYDYAGELWEGKDIGGGLKELENYRKKQFPFVEYPDLIHYYSRNQKGDLKIFLKLSSIYPSHIGDLITADYSAAQHNLAKKLHKKLGGDWIDKSVTIYDGDYTNIKKILGDINQRTVIALMWRLNSILENPLYEKSDKNLADNILHDLENGTSCLIDVSDLPDKDKNSVVTMTTARVAKHWKWAWENSRPFWETLPTLLITLEEAHTFLHKPDKEHKKTIFSEIALSYRKYRVGLLAVTPRPYLIDEDVFGMLWTKIIMKTDLKKDRKYIVDNTPYLEYSDKEIKMLGIGEALLVSEPKIKFAVPIKVTYFQGGGI